ncbi:MAG: hypothetical protein K6F00_07610 [Lachnospiraceae bacterium]|nr:hypothetical protein [Lachnospiraceae bacterium]
MIKSRIRLIYLCFAAMILLTGCGRIKLKKNAIDFVGQNYNDVITEINGRGLTNIETVIIEDPYGFKLHMVNGRLAEQALDENTWFMKYYCTVTNEYGQKIEQNCEAKIKGPEDHPTVYDFYVY